MIKEADLGIVLSKMGNDPAFNAFADEIEKIATETGMDKEAIFGMLARGGMKGLMALRRGGKAIARQTKTMRASMGNKQLAKQTMQASSRLRGPMKNIVQQAGEVGIPLKELPLDISPGVASQIGRLSGKTAPKAVGRAARQAGPASGTIAGGGTGVVSSGGMVPRESATTIINPKNVKRIPAPVDAPTQAASAATKPTSWSMSARDIGDIPTGIPQSAVMRDPLRFGAVKVSYILRKIRENTLKNS